MYKPFKLHPSLLKAILLFFVMLSSWLTRGLELDRFATIDEPRWLMRSANFYRALYKLNLGETFQREHPGVTITWAGTAGLIWHFPGYVKVAQKQLTTPTELNKFLDGYQFTPLELLITGRTFVVLAIVATLGLTFLYAEKLIGVLPALIASLLIAFDPFSIALSRLLNLDGLVSTLMLLSLLAFMIYLYHGRRPIDLLISGAAAGFSWLTKYPALFLVPFVSLLVTIELAQNWRISRRLQASDIWHAFKPILIWFGAGSVIFVLLWPAMWVGPVETLSKMFAQAADYAIAGNRNVTFFNGKIFGSGESAWYFYPITFLWRTTPVVLIGIGLAMLILIFSRRSPFPSEWLRVIWILTLFAVLYTFLVSLGGKKSDRYLLPIHGPLILVATLGWFTILITAREHFFTRSSTTMLYLGTAIIFGVIVFLQLLGVLRTFPYYFNYYNPLMGGGKKADQVMMIGWGEGLDQAAQYLNTVPGAENLRVIAWYSQGCFSYFFKGSVVGMEFNNTIEDLREADYVVMYAHQWQRQLPSQEVLAHFEQLTPEHTVRIGDIEYAQIYNMHEAPALVEPQPDG